MAENLLNFDAQQLTAWFAAQGEPIMKTAITVEKAALLPWRDG